MASKRDLPSLASLSASLPSCPSAEESLDQENRSAESQKASSGSSSPPSPSPIPTTFPLFKLLPAELRLKIWHLSFLPRVVELHASRTLYHNDHDHTRPPKWQSGCSNPAALSACSESRAAALEHYTVAFPLASVSASDDRAAMRMYGYGNYHYNFAMTCGSDVASGPADDEDPGRTLYVSPWADTVAVLGDFDYRRLSMLLNHFREANPGHARGGTAVRSLALSVIGWSSSRSASMMGVFKQSLFRDLEQMILFIYPERFPPEVWRRKGASHRGEELAEQWRQSGARCELVPCEGSSAWRAYKVWSGGKGRQFWDGDGRIMHVGKRELRIMDLKFTDGW